MAPVLQPVLLQSVWPNVRVPHLDLATLRQKRYSSRRLHGFPPHISTGSGPAPYCLCPQNSHSAPAHNVVGVVGSQPDQGDSNGHPIRHTTILYTTHHKPHNARSMASNRNCKSCLGLSYFNRSLEQNGQAPVRGNCCRCTYNNPQRNPTLSAERTTLARLDNACDAHVPCTRRSAWGSPRTTRVTWTRATCAHSRPPLGTFK